MICCKYRNGVHPLSRNKVRVEQQQARKLTASRPGAHSRLVQCQARLAQDDTKIRHAPHFVAAHINLVGFRLRRTHCLSKPSFSYFGWIWLKSSRIFLKPINNHSLLKENLTFVKERHCWSKLGDENDRVFLLSSYYLYLKH